MAHIDKVIVTNVSALKDKYLERYARVAKALDMLIAADAKRGISTRLVALDERRAMKAVRGAPVEDKDSPRQAKDAIDAVCAHYDPDYLMILGAPDVVPHQSLLNPVYSPGDDDDRYVPSDLPYASDHPYSRKISDFRGPTRVVGRLPDQYGFADTFYLARLIRNAARARVRPLTSYERYFGLSAATWHKSTELSLENVFGAVDVHRSPPEGASWRRSQLDALTHFINCHGGLADDKFFGQHGNSYPVALRSAQLRGKVREGTVVAAECCYGAQLYDVETSNVGMGICNRYLGLGAYAFFGSSTIAYGPSEGNGSADLICQFFMQRVLFGASTGRAALEARIQFATHATHLDPTDLKTLAQFNLMGDPSIHAVGKPMHALQRSKVYSGAFAEDPEAVARGQRRKRLLRNGAMLHAYVGAAVPAETQRIPAEVRDALHGSIRHSKLQPGAPLAFSVDDPALESVGEGLRTTKPTAFYVALGSDGKAEPRARRNVVVVATVQDGRIVRLRRLHRRGG